MVGALMSPKTPNDAEEFTFYVWRLSNYSDHFKLGGNKRLKSPVFSLSKDRSLSFSLHFYNKCPVEGYEHFVALGLGIERFGGNKVVKVNFSIWIEEETGGEIVKRDVSYTFNSGLPHRARVLKSFSLRSKLDPQSSFIKDDVLTIYCRIHRDMATPPAPIDNPLKKVFESGVFSDFQIHVQDQTFNTHKVILVAHSEVFSAMLTNNHTKEAQTSSVRLEDAEPNIVESMLRYFYTNEVDNLDSIVKKLYCLADKYRVVDLMDVCVEYLSTNLNVESAPTCLEIAFQYDIPSLKQNSIDFAIHNYKPVMQSTEWKRLRDNNPELSAEIFDFILERSDIECSVNIE